MSAGSPTVSVIIPTYDRPQFLQRALESVLAQKYASLEILVVDDCPSNPVEEIVNSYSDERIRYVQLAENQGVCGARNTGIREATGQYIAFLDDDDRWDEAKIQRQVELAERREGVGVVYTGVRRVNHAGTTLSVSKPKYKNDVGKRLLLNNFVSFSTILIETSVIEQAGVLDEYLTNWEDWEWLIRLAQETKFDFIEDPLASTDRGAHEKRSDNFEKKRDVGFTRFVEKVEPIAASYGDGFQRKAKAHYNYRLGYGALSNRYYSDAKQQFWKAIQYWPLTPKFHMYFAISITGDPGYKAARTTKRWIKGMLN